MCANVLKSYGCIENVLLNTPLVTMCPNCVYPTVLEKKKMEETINNFKNVFIGFEVGFLKANTKLLTFESLYPCGN